MLICSEVKHTDLKKSLRFQQPTNVSQGGVRNTSRTNREEKNPPAAPSINNDWTVMAVCACPDISFEKYSPPGDRPEGVSMEQWRYHQVSHSSVQVSLQYNYKPTICLLTSLGTAILVDIEVYFLLFQELSLAVEFAAHSTKLWD